MDIACVVRQLLASKTDVSIGSIVQRYKSGACIEPVHTLIHAKADPNVRYGGRTPLEIVLGKRARSYDYRIRWELERQLDDNRLCVMKMLLEAKADPFSELVHAPSFRTTKMLLEAKASVDHMHRMGTALFQAVAKRRIPQIKLLLAAKADPHLRVPYLNRTPIEHTFAYPHPVIRRLLI